MTLLLNQKDAASALSISPRTLRRWTDNGTIPHVILGGLLRYRVSDLEAVIEDSVAPASDNAGK